MPRSTIVSGDKDRTPANQPSRAYLESCVAGARHLTPHAGFALGGHTEYIYGTARAVDLANERGLIDYALRFANAKEDAGARKFVIDRQPELASRGETGLDELSAELTREKIEPRRARLAALLTSIYEGTRQVPDPRTEEQLRDVWPIPALQREPYAHLSLCYVIASVDAFDAFLEVLLLDQERPFARDLCCCRLETCGRFFLMKKPKTGRPKRNYCTRNHMLKAHELGSYQRVVKSRERRAKQSKRRRS